MSKAHLLLQQQWLECRKSSLFVKPQGGLKHVRSCFEPRTPQSLKGSGSALPKRHTCCQSENILISHSLTSLIVWRRWWQTSCSICLPLSFVDLGMQSNQMATVFTPKTSRGDYGWTLARVGRGRFTTDLCLREWDGLSFLPALQVKDTCTTHLSTDEQHLKKQNKKPSQQQMTSGMQRGQTRGDAQSHTPSAMSMRSPVKNISSLRMSELFCDFWVLRKGPLFHGSQS